MSRRREKTSQQSPHIPLSSASSAQRQAPSPLPPLVAKGMGGVALLSLLTVVYAIVVALGWHMLQRVPEPLSLYDSDSLFSEGRALDHVRALTEDIGYRMVGTQGNEDAAVYIEGVARKLISEAEQTRPDLLVQVSREQVTGAVLSDFLNTPFINMYNNMSNIILAVSPRAGLREQSVLVNAHFDSPLNTVGASDCASCVGVALELARVLIANQDIKLATPIVFLLNGGEEALCPASHGFMTQSPWALDLGVFVNLESTGPGGPDFLFQQTGRWPIQAYAAVAPYPRGSVVAQDFFVLGLVPADTDYRYFSARVQGRLPGLDTAFLLDSSKYHTRLDTLQNIRPGTVQAMGENSLKLVEEFSKQLMLRRGMNLTEVDDEKAIFFDVLGKIMVTYPENWGAVLHRLPLLLVLLFPAFQPDTLLKPGESLFNLYVGMALEALAALTSLALAVLVCIFVAIFRITSLGSPMVWFGHELAAYAIFTPAAVAGMLMPYLGRTVDAKRAVLGSALAFAVLAAGLTSLGLGSACICVIWALAALTMLTDTQPHPVKLQLFAVINSIPPMVVIVPTGIALSLYMMQKTSFMGAQGQPHFTPLVADAVVGAVVGLTVASGVGALAPWLAHAAGKGLRRLVLFLIFFSTLFAIHASVSLSAYTADAPKKVLLQHLHEHGADGSIHRSKWAVGAVDSLPVTGLLGEQEADLWAATKSGWEWQVTYPIDERFVLGELLQAPGPAADVQLPGMLLLKRESPSTGIERLHIQLSLPGAGYFGAFNVSGRILNWSLPEWHSKDGSGRLIRFAGTGDDIGQQFIVDIPTDGTISIRLAAATAAPSQEIEDFIAPWPEEVDVVRMTSFASTWIF